jgi:hypothetical protein
MRQQIVVGLKIDYLFCFLSFRNITRRSKGTDEILTRLFIRIGVSPLSRQVHPHRLGVKGLVSHPRLATLNSEFDVARCPIASTPFVEQVARGVEIFLVDEIGIMFTEQFLLRNAQ